MELRAENDRLTQSQTPPAGGRAEDDAAPRYPLNDAIASVENGLLRAHGVAAMATLLVSVIFGTLVALKFNFPDFLGGQAWLTWGRLRYNHTQGIFFGWLGNAFFVFLYYAVPRLADRPVFSRKLGWWLFVLWNFAVVLPGWVLVAAGFSQPLEWAEFPLVVDAFVIVAFVLAVVQFVIPFFRTKLAELYVSGWYIIGAIIFTLLAYPVGNIVPELVPGARGAAFSGLWIHDAIGLYVTPLAVAIAYYVIPAVTGRAIYSHFLSMIGFWLLFFVYPLNGMHHYVYSALPMEAQKGAIIASVYLGMDVILVVANLLLSLRGSSGAAGRDVPLRFVWTGIIFYLVVSLQGSLQALMPVNRLTHFSDWVIGHSHLAMLGFATFIAAGGIAHVWQCTPGARYNARAIAWSYWLLLTGVLLMVVDLTVAGLVEAHLWQTDLPWLESVRAVRSYWLVRSLTALPLILGFIAFWLGIATRERSANIQSADISADIQEARKEDEGRASKSTARHEGQDAQEQAVLENLNEATTGGGLKWLKLAFVVAFVAGVGFFALSFLVLGILPGHALEREVQASAPATMPELTASEERGRSIYAREGCAYCHTQQVRFISEDIARFGAPTEAWETKYDYPQLWGTRRIGPDLAREGGLRSNDWQLTHLYNPRLVVRDSVMPGYPWLFNGAATHPTQEGRDLLAYLQSLGRARQLSGYDQRALLSRGAAHNAGREVMTGRADVDVAWAATSLTVSTSPNAARSSSATPLFTPSTDPNEFIAEARRGAEVFAQNCATCHGARGRGDGAAAASLLPRPADLTAAEFSTLRLSQVLWNGVAGSSMPAWRDLPPRDLQSLVAYVQTLHTRAPDRDVRPDTLKRGQQLFAVNCVRCHGLNGAGDGVAGRALAPAPTNFQLKRPDAEQAWLALLVGRPGTAMPPWAQQLSDDERRALIVYIRSLYGAPTERQER